MVASSAGPDACAASELGSLLHARAMIVEPRLRLASLVPLLEAFARLRLPAGRLRAELRAGLTGAVCPRPLRETLVELTLESPTRTLIDALWSRSWVAASIGAVRAMLAHDRAHASNLVARIPDRTLRRRVGEMVRSGIVEGRFVGDPRGDHPATLAKLIAAVDARWRGEVVEVDPIASPLAAAQLARLALLESPTAAAARVRSIRARGPRAAAGLLLVEACLARGLHDEAARFAAAIAPELARQRARLAIARACFERAEVRAALRLLQTIDRRELTGERWVLHAEIRLAVRRDREPVLERLPACPRACDVLAAIQLRASIRCAEPVYIPRLRLATASTLELFERCGIPVLSACSALSDRRAIDALCVAMIDRRASRLGSMPPAFRDGLAARGLATTDPLARALYDEATAWIEPRRRRVLISVAHASLRTALTRPEPGQDEVVAARLRTLVQLGGQLGRDALAKPLATLPLSRFALPALEALCVLDAPAAAAIVFARASELDPARALPLVEAYRGVPAGFASAWARARLVHDDAWLASLTTALLRDRGQLSVAALDLATHHAGTVEALLARIATVGSHLAGELPVIARQLLEAPDLFEFVELAHPARVDARLRWTRAEWRAHLARAARCVLSVAPRVIERFVHLLGRSPMLPVRVLERADLRVRLLDKRADVLTYLRFADVPAPSCYRSDSRWYNSSLDTRQDVLVVWSDPLAFCFHVERAGKPYGFVFGGFARLGSGRLAIVLNGLYLRSRSADVREQVLRAVEELLAPLGIRELAIANRHGGHGDLPADYEQRTVELIRLRALTHRGELVRYVQDDIGSAVNERITTQLWWRRAAA